MSIFVTEGEIIIITIIIIIIMIITITRRFAASACGERRMRLRPVGIYTSALRPKVNRPVGMYTGVSRPKEMHSWY